MNNVQQHILFVLCSANRQQADTRMAARGGDRGTILTCDGLGWEKRRKIFLSGIRTLYFLKAGQDAFVLGEEDTSWPNEPKEPNEKGRKQQMKQKSLIPVPYKRLYY
jgi:hypothetical protein